MALAGHTQPLQSPTGFLAAQERYGRIRREIMEREREEIKESEKSFINLMSVDSMNALVDGYQNLFKEEVEKFQQAGGEAFRNGNLRLTADDRMQLNRMKRDLEQKRTMYEESFNNYVEDRNRFAQDRATGKDTYDAKWTQKRLDEAYASMRKGEVYTKGSVFVPSFVPVEETFMSAAKANLGAPRKVVTKDITVENKVRVEKTKTWISNYAGATEGEMYANRYKETMDFLRQYKTDKRAQASVRTMVNVVNEALNTPTGKEIPVENMYGELGEVNLEELFREFHLLKGGEVTKNGHYVGGAIEAYGTIREDLTGSTRPDTERAPRRGSPDYYATKSSTMKNFSTGKIKLEGESLVYQGNSEPIVTLGQEVYGTQLGEGITGTYPAKVVAVGADKVVLRFERDDVEHRTPIERSPGVYYNENSPDVEVKAFVKATNKGNPNNVILGDDGVWYLSRSIRRDNVVVPVDPDEDSNLWRALDSIDPSARVKAREYKRKKTSPSQSESKKKTWVEWKKENATGTPAEYKAYING